jgi:hypothetical protein
MGCSDLKKLMWVVPVAGVLAAMPASAQVAVEDIKVQFLLEQSGRLSDNISATKTLFKNAVLAGGGAGEPADALLVTLVFTGAKNTRASDKIARDMASVTVTQTTKLGPKILLKRAFAGFQFGETGRAYKAFSLENATCAPLEVSVKIGKSQKTAKLDFECDLPKN